ncbi:MAG: alkaline phosphatase [Dehalococcoidia bacterium]|nr:alkaline phosphatase [Dehalococcoidia bacterium]
MSDGGADARAESRPAGAGAAQTHRVVALLVLAFGILIALLAIAILPRQGSHPSPAASSAPLASTASPMPSFELVADAYTSADEPSANFGEDVQLRVDGSPELVAYLGFRVHGEGSEPIDAILRLYANSSSNDGGEVRAVVGDGELDEDSLSADDAPEPGEALGFTGPLSAGEWIEIELEGLEADEFVTLALTTGSDTARSFGSRESGQNAPQLQVVDPTVADPTVGSSVIEPTAEIALEPLTNDDAVLIAVGDIASCGSTGDEDVADLVAQLDGTLAILGDVVYEEGTHEQYRECFDPAWGRFKDRTRPAVGNHEYLTEGAAGYYDYFGAAAGDPSKGYYSYNLGAWHIVVLNSMCSRVGGCGPGSPQGQWLREDLEANTSQCTLAYFHHPRFSSGQHGNFEALTDMWETLDEFGVELVLSGHDHSYERFAPQDASGQRVDEGIRQFVVGTGGKNHYEVGPPIPNSEIADGETFGVLKLDLRPGGYAWQFIPVPGSTFTDAGEDTCH